MLDLVFVGAGPHALTALARLLEPNPDTSIDEPHRKATAKAKVLRYWHRQRTCPRYRAALTAWLRRHVAVVDPSGDWMVRWQQQFAALGITHLRSTTAVHPDPLDTYALATYAAAAGRLGELQALRHVAKDRHFAGPFAVPGAALFEDFCRDLLRRYCLDGLVTADTVVDLTPVYASPDAPAHTSSSNTSSGSDSAAPALQPQAVTRQAAAPGTRHVQHWVVCLASGRQLTVRRVVVGIGSTNAARTLATFQLLQPVATRAVDASSSSSSAAAGATPPADAGSIGVSDGDGGGAAADSACCSSDGCDGACSSSSGWSWASSETGAAGGGAAGARAAECRSGGSSCCSSPTKQESALQYGFVQQLNEAWRQQQQQQQEEEEEEDDNSSASAAGAEPTPAAAPGFACAAAGQPGGAAADFKGHGYPAGRLMHAWQLVQLASSSSTPAGCDAAGSGASTSSGTGGALGRGSSGGGGGGGGGGASRTLAAARRLRERGLLLPGEEVLIVGGGLTSVHLAALAASAAGLAEDCAHDGAAGCGSDSSASRGPGAASGGSAARAASCHGTPAFGPGGPGSGSGAAAGAGGACATLLLRGGLRVKQFDVDIPWMGRHRRQKLAADFRPIRGWRERARALRQALQGGSVPPEAAAILQQLRQAGQLQVHEHSEVVAADWDWQQQRWHVWLQDGSALHPHRVWLATGSSVDAAADPLLSSLLRKLPVPVAAGMPALQPTLEWAPGSGLYVLGAYAALQLGPGALNLAGAKTASVLLQQQQLQRHLPPLPL